MTRSGPWGKSYFAVQQHLGDIHVRHCYGLPGSSKAFGCQLARPSSTKSKDAGSGKSHIECVRPVISWALGPMRSLRAPIISDLVFKCAESQKSQRISRERGSFRRGTTTNVMIRSAHVNGPFCPGSMIVPDHGVSTLSTATVRRAFEGGLQSDVTRVKHIFLWMALASMSEPR